MKPAVFFKGSVLALTLFSTLAYSTDTTTTDTTNTQTDTNTTTTTQENTTKRPMVMLDGYVGTFSKFGFNNQRLDDDKGKYPTESYTALITQLDLNIDPTDKLGWQDTSLVFDVGATLGGLAYDSTKTASDSGKVFAEIGIWPGFAGTGNATGNNTRNVLVHNAYVAFTSKYFDFQGGRYESTTDYLSGYTQGFDADFHYNFGQNKNSQVKAWMQASWARAQAYSNGLNDYFSATGGWQRFSPTSRSRTNRLTNLDGSGYNLLGYFQAGIDVLLANADGGNSIMFRPFTVFTPLDFTAFGGKVVGTYAWGDFTSNTTLEGYAVRIDDEEWNAAGEDENLELINNIRYNLGQQIDRTSYNLSLIQTFTYKNYDFGLGLYKNFGHANAFIGTIGNSTINSIVDVYPSTIYEVGPSQSAILGRNAFSAYGWFGGDEDVGIGTLTWHLLGRYTNSTKSDENAISLELYQQFQTFGVGLTLQWLQVHTNNGYKVGQVSRADVPNNFAGRTDDRSHAYFYIDYKFSTGIVNFAKKSYKKL
ncbi:outer membrane family protein [Helicobacter sp. 11S02629-2]|uniref:outer membrane family protein n=1 Tax=Helicobacter sp. 11S02629-2 TaxID=1476195 RepID=UPI000BD93F99|nr:outer membrane family protein [Helicobacter sp. 11S02629-2]PAF45855.1 hypothetical protein BKH40_00105 [Helicobacter sp. 11S02629-2]